MANNLAESNDAQFFQSPTAVAARDAEKIDAAGSFENGMNLGASNAPGIGIATGGGVQTTELSESLPNWTLLDQDGDARTPQVSQPIGGTGLGGTYPASGGAAAKGTEPVVLGEPDASGDGTAVAEGDATLADLAAGWTAV